MKGIFTAASTTNRLVGIVVVLLVWSSSSPVVLALDNGLGLVPAMGWNAWNPFGCDITQDLIVEAADRIKELELDKLGYRYVNIDDCWSLKTGRTSEGTLTGDPVRFSHGMKWIGDYLHSLDLKFGIYSSAGTETCAHYPASLGYETVDAQTWADWGVDYLKYDNCNNHDIPSIDRFSTMRNALNATGRPILFSLCQWGHESTWQWAPAVGNSWRADGDMQQGWRGLKISFHNTNKHFEAAGPGAWLDPDMLLIGSKRLNYDECKSHFSLWTLTKAPLLLGMDLRTIPDDLLGIIQNKNLIDINQDPLTHMATKRHAVVNDDDEDDFAVYAATRGGDGSMVAILINWGEFEQPATTLNIVQILGIVPFPEQVVTVQDLWTNEPVYPPAKGGSPYFNFEDLKQVPVPTLAKHACAVYSFTLPSTSPK